MYKRDKYLNELIESKNNGFVKVITGIRRCGKSTLLDNIYRQYLLDNGIFNSDIIFMDLSDTGNTKYCDPIYLNDYILKLTEDQSRYFYVFLDEIQHVYSIVNPNLTGGKHRKARKEDTEIISFVNTVLGLSKRKNIDIYVTGSNSKMLSKDIITEFRDKATEIHMKPFSFEEFYEVSGMEKEEAFSEYMLHGGMPLAISKKSETDKEKYLKDLYELTYIKDIVEYNHFRNEGALSELGRFLASNVGQFSNPTNIANTFESSRKQKLDRETVESYIGAFENAFVITKGERYDINGKRYIGANYKYYFADPGLRNACLNFNEEDSGKVMENIIYNELVYKGYSVDVGLVEINEPNANGNTVRKQLEVDFIATKGNKKYYIQSAFEMNDEKKKMAEKRSLMNIKDFNKRILVTRLPQKPRIDEDGIVHIGVTDLLCLDDLGIL